MPEGDTLHKIAHAMQPLVVGHTVVQLRLRDRGAVDEARGQTVEHVDAIGKHLVIRFSGELGLRVHLGMRGRWRRFRGDTVLPGWAQTATVVLRTADHTLVCTRASQARLLHGSDVDRDPAVIALGPDLLRDDIDLSTVVSRARASDQVRRAIGEQLLDQRVAAGIGNVYKSEVLFSCRVDPWAAVGDLDDATLRRVYQTASELMRANVDRGRRVTISRPALRPTRGPRLWVYGRARQPCLECGAAIEVRHQGDQARSTFFCPRCQAPPAARAK